MFLSVFDPIILIKNLKHLPILIKNRFGSKVDWYSPYRTSTITKKKMNRFKRNRNKEPVEKMDFDCVMRDRFGNPICFMKRENARPNFQNDRALDRELKAEFMNVQIARSNLYFRERADFESDPEFSPWEQNQQYYEQLLTDDTSDIFEKENASNSEIQNEDGKGGPDKSNSDPTQDFPGEDIDYPEEDEILDDDPLRNIEEPAEEELDNDEIPGETQIPRIDKMGEDDKFFL
jgi:hypothetical protein